MSCQIEKLLIQFGEIFDIIYEEFEKSSRQQNLNENIFLQVCLKVIEVSFCAFFHFSPSGACAKEPSGSDFPMLSLLTSVTWSGRKTVES